MQEFPRGTRNCGKISRGIDLQVHYRVEPEVVHEQVSRKRCRLVNESRGETILLFMDFHEENGQTKSSEEISRSTVVVGYCGGARRLQWKCQRILSSGGQSIDISQLGLLYYS